ncbi:MAG TPA: hypothetical protein VN950_03085 [Terriglobales bacterium]|nr:hypothetical protein [Terriglobales bacterium]
MGFNEERRKRYAEAIRGELENVLKKIGDDERQQIAMLQEQMQADSTASIQAKTAAHTSGICSKARESGVGASLLLFALVFGVKKSVGGFTVTKKPQARSTSE